MHEHCAPDFMYILDLSVLFLQAPFLPMVAVAGGRDVPRSLAAVPAGQDAARPTLPPRGGSRASAQRKLALFSWNELSRQAG